MDYIGLPSADLVTFDLSDLSNRDVLTDTYEQVLTLVFEVWYIAYPTKRSYTFNVKEYDCTPQTSPALFTVLANTEVSKTQSYSKFAALGINASVCGITSTRNFELSGPATGGVFLDITDSTISSWVASLYEDLTISNDDQASVVNYEGRYAVKNYSGLVTELSELLICYI